MLRWRFASWHHRSRISRIMDKILLPFVSRRYRMNFKPFLILALSIALVGVAVAQTRPQSRPMTPPPAGGAGAVGGAAADIKARGDAFAAAWNKHDPKAMAALWAADGDLID